MKRSRNIIWGTALVLLGVIWGGNALELFDINPFFDGWWTLFIIVPSTVGLISDNDKTSNFITLIIGVLLLLACQDIIDFSVFWKLLVPIIIIWIGLSLILKGTRGTSFKSTPIAVSGNLNAIFAGHEVKVDDEFKGTDLTAIFGGIDLDLRKAKFTSDVTINVCAIFGGVDIYVPSDIKVKIQTTSIFGGVDKSKLDDEIDAKYTIFINATCIFGGAEIKR